MQQPDSLPDVGDRYRIRRLIGVGGMGRVYLAEDVAQDRLVAVKVLDPGLGRFLGAARFLREIRVLSKLVHPNIVALYDSGDYAEYLYYVMPFIEGSNLRERLRRDSQIALDVVLGWARELGDALTHAHQCGFIHRDIKPENVLLNADHAILADFGVARAINLAGGESLTSEGWAVGTPAYMSPEQAAGERKLDVRSDIYSLACVIYELLAGEPPFGGATDQAIIARKMAHEYRSLAVVRPLVPRHIDLALAKATAPNPVDRFADVAAFVRALTTTSGPARRMVAVAAAIVVATVAVMVGRELRSTPDGARRPALRIVVARFDNRTGDPGHDSFGMVAAHWLTDGLYHVGGIDVVPTATALPADQRLRAGRNLDPVRELAHETGANMVVVGSSYYEGDSLVVRAELVDANGGGLIGAAQVVRTGKAELTASLSELRTRLLGLVALRSDERVALGPTPAIHPPAFEAYEAFSVGLDAYVRNDMRQAAIEFRKAAEIDSSFALALLYSSMSHINLREYATADSVLAIAAEHRSELSAHDRYWLDYAQAELRGQPEVALTAIRRVATMAPGSKATYNLAVQALQARQPAVAESALRSLSPDRGPMRAWFPYWDVLADARHAQSRHEAELEAAVESRRRHPDRPEAIVLESRALAALGRTAAFARLLEVLRRDPQVVETAIGLLEFEFALELEAHGDSVVARPYFERAHKDLSAGPLGRAPDVDYTRLRAAASLGLWPEALRIGQSLVRSDPSRPAYQGALGVGLVGNGRLAEAKAISDQLASDAARVSYGFPQLEAARISVALGDTVRANGLLEAAVRRGYPYNLDFHRDPTFRALRHNPRFAIDAR